ncbi:MAG: 30S ribosomal protein S11 [Patescibacteria group bacterium]
MATTTKSKATKKKNTDRRVESVRFAVTSTFNNTIVTASDLATGQVLDWTSSGRAGFKGTKKGTPYAATSATKTLIDTVMNSYKPEIFYVDVSGAGNGRDAALRAIAAAGIKIAKIQDTTRLPHNGCRAKKARRA